MEGGYFFKYIRSRNEYSTDESDVKQMNSPRKYLASYVFSMRQADVETTPLILAMLKYVQWQ